MQKRRRCERESKCEDMFWVRKVKEQILALDEEGLCMIKLDFFPREIKMICCFQNQK